MEHQLTIYNTLNRKKELFVPLHAPHVGMYVCGPTVYGDPHLGHARPAITFDLLFRYLTHIGYKVRYVRNITDVGHLEHDADEGEDKIAKKARLEQLEPMEVAQYYINRYHKAMDTLNVLSPSIEPHASGHIIEQIELVKEILKNGYAYESEGSVYFDVKNTIRTITTASSPDATWMMFSTPPANWTDRARSTTPQTLPSGNVRNRNTSCVGLPRGATASPAGTPNVQPWERNTWASTSTFMVAAWTLSSRITNARLHNP